MTNRLSRLLRTLLLVPVVALVGPVYADSAAASRYYEDGLVRFGKNDVAGAIIQLKNALQQDRDMLAAHLLLAKAYFADGDLGPAEVEFREAVRLGVSPAEVAVPMGRIYLMQGRPQKLLDAITDEGLSAAARLEVQVLRGRAFAAVGKLAEATSSFAAARALDPTSPIPLVAEVPMLLANGQGEEARLLANRAIELAPDDAGARNARASILHASARLDEALAEYEKAIALEPVYLDARVARAGILIDLGRVKDAGADLEDLARAAPPEPRVAYLRALVADMAGDKAAAAALLEETATLVDALPPEWLAGQEQLLMTGALAHYAGRQYEKARKYLDVLVARYAHNLGARKLLAAVYVNTGEYPKATKLLEDVLRALPDDAQALQLLGRTYLGLKRYSKATELLERAVAIGGRGADLQASLGFSLLGQGNESAAISSLQAAFDTVPSNLTLAVTLSNFYMRQGLAEKALATAKRAVAAAPESNAALNLLGMIHAASGDLAAARAAYRQALQRDPGFLPARLNLARVDAESGDFEAARKTYVDLLQKNRRDVNAMYELGLLEGRAGRPSEALRWIEKAAAEQPGSIRVGLALVDLLAAAGNKPGALEAARALAVRNRDNLTAMAALARAEIDAGSSKAAQQTLRDMTRLAEFDTPALVRIGYLQLAASNPEGAAYNAKKGLQGKPDDLPSLVLGIEAALAMGDLEGADQQLKRLRGKDAGNIDVLRLTGNLAQRRQQYAAAADAYRQAFEQKPESAGLIRYVRVLVEQGNAKLAIPIVQRWLAQHKNDRVAREALGELHMRVDNWGLALREYESLIAEGLAGAATYNNLANVLIETKDPKAVGIAEKAVSLAETDAGALDTLGWALAQAGRFEESIRYLRDARLRAPDNKEVRWHLGYVLAKTGRAAEAREELDVALRGAGDQRWAGAARSMSATLK